MEELKWPVEKCENCGFKLSKAEPKPVEKSNDASGRLTWTDFCPECGYGYNVGTRVLPAPSAEALAEMEAASVLSSVSEKAVKGKSSGIPPDERGEELTKEKPETPPAGKKEPGAIRTPGKSEYFCTKCASIHSLKETSKIGKRHLKYRE